MNKYLFTVLWVLFALPVFAHDFDYTYEGQTLKYTVLDEEDKTVKTKDGDGSSLAPGNNVSGSLVIPEVVKDGDTEYTVIGIGSLAFNNCVELTEVTIPNSIKTIGDEAFYNCNSLTTVTFGNSVETIRTCAFYKCVSIKEIIIPNSVRIIGETAFSECGGLKELTIGNSVETISRGAFSYCYNLNSVTLPNSVKRIESYAFTYCTHLTSVTLPGSITYIGNFVFDYCFPASVYYAATDPISGNSNIFWNYHSTLYVPEEAVEKCKQIDPWKNFISIEPYEFSSMEEISAKFESDLPIKVYNVGGVLVGSSIENLAPGIYIVSQGNIVKKITVK